MKKYIQIIIVLALVLNTSFLLGQEASIAKKDIPSNKTTPTQIGNDIAIKPTFHLLWYKGFIGKYPIKLMLKWSYNTKTNNKEISSVAYGYDSKEKLIYLQDCSEPQAGIFCYEKDKSSPRWSVAFTANQVLKGDWNNQNGTVLPITLTPMAKTFPEYTFTAELERKLKPNGEVSHQIVKGFTVYENNKELQHIKVIHEPIPDYFSIGYVDINYDGYLDLISGDTYYLFNPKTTSFETNKTDEDYFRYLDVLEQYNLYDKSFTAQMNRAMIEHRAINGALTPYHSSSYFPNADGDMVIQEQRYENGTWETIEERIESMEHDVETDPEVDTPASKNYALNLDLTPYNGSIYFAPTFYRITDNGETFKQKSKLFVEVTSANKIVYQQYLSEVALTNEKKQTLDDTKLLYNGKNYVLDSYLGPIPFFPSNLKNGDYTFRLKLEHPLFGELYSKAQQISVPLAIKESSKYIHLKGGIGASVKGDLYFVVGEPVIKGTFINAKTDQRIKLTGELKGKILNLKEYEKEDEDELSGYFEGEFIDGVYKGYWLSPSRKTKVPFEFIQ